MTPDHKYLEIIKLYLPGYVAEVNGVEFPVMESERKAIIRLENGGLNNMKLPYVETPDIRITFYVSSRSWGLSFIFLMMKLILRRRRLQLMRGTEESAIIAR